MTDYSTLVDSLIAASIGAGKINAGLALSIQKIALQGKMDGLVAAVFERMEASTEDTMAIFEAISDEDCDIANLLMIHLIPLVDNFDHATCDSIGLYLYHRMSFAVAAYLAFLEKASPDESMRRMCSRWLGSSKWRDG